MVKYRKLSAAQFIVIAGMNGLVLFDDLVATANDALDGNLASEAAEVFIKLSATMPDATSAILLMLERISGFLA